METCGPCWWAIARDAFCSPYNFDTLSRTRQIPSLCTENQVAFDAMHPGNYRAEYWDLRNGKTTLCQNLRVAADGLAVLHPPAFTEGWAIKILPGSDGTASDSTNPPVAVQPPRAPASEIPSRAMATPPATEAEWSWRIQPLVTNVSPSARERSLVEVRLAVPETCRQLYPRLVDAAGTAVPFAWQSLADGTGWQLRVPRRLCHRPHAGHDGCGETSQRACVR